MTRLQVRTVLLMTLFCATQSAHAAHYLLIGAEGERAPERRYSYADLNYNVSRLEIPLEQAATVGADALLDAKVERISVIQVVEAAEAPDTITYTVEYHCKRKQVRFAEVIEWHRNGTQTISTPNEWANVGSGWPSRGYVIACERDKLQKAVKAASAGKIDQLTNLGMVYAGDHVLQTDLSDFTWGQFWKDNTRAPYSSVLTAQEQEQRKQAFLAQSDVTLAKAKDFEKETKFMIDVSDNFDRKSDDQKQEFAGMQGWTEQQVIDSWGAPDNSAQGGETRSLVYSYQKSRYDVVNRSVDIVGSRGGKVGEASRLDVQASMQNCKRVLSFRQGGSKPGYRLHDYSYDCP